VRQRIANRGNVILIGRGAHIIIGQLSHAFFHVRLVGSLAKRIEHIQEIRGLGKAEALEFIRQEDRGRERHLKKYFGKAVDDDLSYHLVINTDCVSLRKSRPSNRRSRVGTRPNPAQTFAARMIQDDHAQSFKEPAELNQRRAKGTGFPPPEGEEAWKRRTNRQAHLWFFMLFRILLLLWLRQRSPAK
jgi:hypothetical protein